MTIVRDDHGMNHMITAISLEMTPAGPKRTAESDALFMGGPAPTDDQQRALARFGLSKNWKIIYTSFDPVDPLGGPIAFHVVATDGLTEAVFLENGRLWKRDRRSSAILVFAEHDFVITFSAKGRVLVRPAKRDYGEEGYALALEVVRARAAGKPGLIPVVSTVGTLPTIVDIRTMNHAFAMAA